MNQTMTMNNQAVEKAPVQVWSGHMGVDEGATSGPVPRAVLEASETGLKLSGTHGHFQLVPATVKSVQRAGFYPWVWGGIRIHHCIPGYPKHLEFCPIGVRSHIVLDRLRQLGYPVA